MFRFIQLSLDLMYNLSSLNLVYGDDEVMAILQEAKLYLQTSYLRLRSCMPLSWDLGPSSLIEGTYIAAR
jgi:hypothetical protein